MTSKYCNKCKKNISLKFFYIHRHIYLCKSNYPNDILNIIYDYKNQLDIFEKYNKFYKFIIFYNKIRLYENIDITYNCFYYPNKIYYLDEMLYIMKHILPDFKYEIKNILTNKKLKKKNYNIKI